MRHLRLRRPSGAMVVSVVALVMATTGTAVATHERIFSSDIVDGQVQGRDIGLDQVGKADVGNNAFGSREAYDNALGSVDIKDGDLRAVDIDLNTLAQHALVRADGAQVFASPGISVASHTNARTILNMGKSVANQPILVSLAGTGSGELSAAPCGATPGGASCPGAFNNPNHVVVDHNNSAGNPDARPFYVYVPKVQ